MLDIGSSQSGDLLPPILWRQIQVYGTNQIADAAALVRFFNSCPEAVELVAQQIGLIEQYGGVRQQIEDRAIGSGHGSVKLPAGENCYAARANCGFDDFFRAGDPFPGKPD